MFTRIGLLRQKQRRHRRGPKAYRPWVEPLEDRRMLAVVYVDLDATGGDNGTSWGDAYVDLQDGLAAAANGDEIWVAEGTYRPTGGSDRAVSFNLKSRVHIYGGFGGTETARDQRDWTIHSTILSGNLGASGRHDNSYHVVYAHVVTDATLDGITITGGNANRSQPWDAINLRGGGMYNYHSTTMLNNVTFSGNSAWSGGGMWNERFRSPTLTNVTFSGNSATSGPGGGMYNYFSSPTLTNVTFRGNSAIGGGGINNWFSSPTLNEVTFSGNSVEGPGGGIWNTKSSVALTDVTFRGNSARSGGGMYNKDRSSATLNNVTFSGNMAENLGGGMHLYDRSSATLTNVTFSGNSAGNRGGGIWNTKSSVTLTNSILWGNTASIGPQIYNEVDATATVTYSIVQGGWAGTGNLDADPMFVDAAAGDLHLKPGSPAIDTGTATGAPSFDRDGNPRPFDGDADGIPEFDMGAFEVQFAPDTLVEIVGDDLHIVDIKPGGKTDNLRVRWDRDTKEIVIEDPTNVMAVTVPGATGNGTHEVRVPRAAVKGQTIVDLLEGNDRFVMRAIPTATTINGHEGGDRILIRTMTRPTTVDGGAEGDKFWVGSTENWDRGTLDLIMSTLTFVGNSNPTPRPDKLYVNDRYTTGEAAYLITPASITYHGVPPFASRFGSIHYDGTLESVCLDVTDQANVIDVQPSLTTEFHIDGNLPALGEVVPHGGDHLRLDTQTTGTVGHHLEINGPGSWQWTFTSGHQPVKFESIERFKQVVIVAFGADAGTASKPRALEYDAETMELEFSRPDVNDTAATRVPARDIDDDGQAEILAAQGHHSPEDDEIRRFEPLTGRLVDSFFADHPDFSGGGLFLG